MCYKIILSPFLGGQCRFYPSCSDYAMEVLERFPLRQAASKILKRLLSCHPYNNTQTENL